MVEPTATQKAQIIATCTAAIMASPEAWRAFEHEKEENQSFEEWAVNRGTLMAKEIFDRVS